LDFGKFSHGHVDSAGSATVAGWDFVANKSYNGSVPDEDIDVFLSA
jgi:hypothetical protein